MRSTLLALFLCAGAAAFCQSGTPAQTNPSKLKPTLPPLTQPWKDFSKFPPTWQMNGSAPLKMFNLQSPIVPRRFNDAGIDPMIILHPPQSSIGVQPPGVFVAQNEYPGLEFLPIQAASAKLQPIPILWPNARLEAIPALLPRSEILPIDTSKTPPTGTQGK